MINTITLPPFKKMCVTIGNLPTSFVESMSYYEALCWMYNYLDKTVIPAINTEGEAITELQAAFITLKTYVDNYFENLDVQEEINNKLDDMAESGELTEIIAEYLGLAGVLAYNTVADMKAAENLVNGSIAKTLGYHSVNDGGSAFYKIRTITNNDTVNEMDIIALHDETLVAEYIKTDKIYIKQFGCYCDATNDDTDAYQYAINYASTNNLPLIGSRDYSLISKTLKIPVPIDIKHLYLKASDTITNFTSSYMIFLNTTNGTSWDKSYNSLSDNKIEDIKLWNPTTSNDLNGFKSIANVQINNMYTYGLNKSFDSATTYYVDAVEMNNIMISHKIGSNYCIDIGYLGDMISITNAHIYDTIGDNYFIRFNGAHRPSKIENIINGIIYLNYGNISLKNYHGEGENKSHIELNNGTYSLDTINITDNKPCIKLDKATANISNFISGYNYQNSYTTDNDIYLSNYSRVELSNSFKDIATPGEATDRLYSKIKTNVNDLNYFKNDSISNFTNEFINTKTFNIVSQYVSSGIRESQTGSWKLAAGTYYYKICPYYDRERGIRSNYVGDRNITLGANAGTVLIEGVPRNLPIRVMRGTESGVFTHYVDLLTVDPSLRDNGNIINGKIWEAFDTSVTVFNGQTGYWFVRYQGDNIVTMRNSAPTAGTWKAGDIVYNGTPTAGTARGWICTADGTPGTWITMANNQ